MARCHSFCLFLKFYIPFILSHSYSTFIRRHSLRFLSISSSLWSAHWEKPPWGAEPRIELRASRRNTNRATPHPISSALWSLTYSTSCMVLFWRHDWWTSPRMRLFHSSKLCVQNHHALLGGFLFSAAFLLSLCMTGSHPHKAWMLS